jgi:hypothetical protein
MKLNGILLHKFFRKKTHMDSYLHANYHHHPSQKFGVLKTLARRETRISDDEHLDKEIDHVTKVFRGIGYKDRYIKKEMKIEERRSHSRNNQTSNIKSYLPYIRGITYKIAKILRRKEIITSFKPLITIRQKMRFVKFPINHRQDKSVYNIFYSCGKFYIGETKELFQIRIKEHERDIKNECIHT